MGKFLPPPFPRVATVVLAAIINPPVEVGWSPDVVDETLAGTRPFEVAVVVGFELLVSRPDAEVLVAMPPPPMTPPVTIPVIVPVQDARVGQQATLPLPSAAHAWFLAQHKPGAPWLVQAL